jgi:hypothetical protein
MGTGMRRVPAEFVTRPGVSLPTSLSCRSKGISGSLNRGDRLNDCSLLDLRYYHGR